MSKFRDLLPSGLLLCLGIALTAIFYQVGHRSDLKSYVPEFIALMLLAGILYLVAVYITWRFRLGPAALLIIVSAAVGFRLCVLPLAPQLSDDVYRYQWEGRIQRAGMNPYTVYPALADLEHFQDPAHLLQAGQYTPTVYPPLSETVFSWLQTIGAYKRLFTALDVASMVALLMILAALKQPAQHVLAYAWSPAVVISFAMCGHHDSLAIFTVLTATLLIIARRPALSGAFLALSTLSKFFAVLLVPLFLRFLDGPNLDRPELAGATVSNPHSSAGEVRGTGSRSHTRGSFFSWTFAAVLVLGYVPYLGAGRRVFGGLRNYAAVWEANDSLFRLVRHAGNSQAQAELVVIVILAGLIGYMVRDVHGVVMLFRSKHHFPSANPQLESAIPDLRLYLPRAALILFAALVLLSPNAFPWYFTWSIPFLCFYPSAPWLLMTVTAVLGYAPVVAYAAGQPYLHSPLILILEYGPVLGWLVWTGIHESSRHGLINDL